MVGWVKKNALKWFGHVKRMGSKEFVKVFESKSEGPNKSGRPLGNGRIEWRSALERERGISGRRVLEQARKECWDRKRWRL